jgi:hypothetical protein
MKKDTIESLTAHYNDRKNKDITEYVSLETFLNECKTVERAIKNHKLVIVAKNKEYSQFDVFTHEKDGMNRLMPITKKLI